MSILLSPITALVEFEIRASETSMEEWLDVWGHRGDDALLGEPETSAYEALTSSQAPQQVLIFERYDKGDASLQAHVERPAHAQLTETMGERRMTRRRVMSNLFVDVVDYGWWGRPEQTTTMRDPNIKMMIIVSRFNSETAKQAYLELTGEHAAYCKTEEPGTLVYSCGIAHRDADRGPEVKAGDLLFVAAFANDAAAEKHRIDPDHLALQKKLESIERERILVQQYETTGKGFLWSKK